MAVALVLEVVTLITAAASVRVRSRNYGAGPAEYESVRSSHPPHASHLLVVAFVHVAIRVEERADAVFHAILILALIAVAVRIVECSCASPVKQA